MDIDVLKGANEWADDSIEDENAKHTDLTSYFNYVKEEKILKKIGKELGDKLAENFSQKQIESFLYEVLEGAKKSWEIQKHDSLMEDNIGKIFEDVDPSDDRDRARERLAEKNMTKNNSSVFDNLDPSDLL